MRVLLFIYFISILGRGFANPTNPIVMNGHATFSSPSANELYIHANDKAVIHWKNFSIDCNEVTRFIQPSETAVVLNRITGLNGSEILGRLEANGHLYLINQQGILFGKNAVINVGGMTASTLDFSNEDFFTQEALLFKGTGGHGIENQGVIQATHGDIILLSHKVKNDGLLLAPNGTVGIGAGHEILLKPQANEKIYIRAFATESSEEVGVETLGKIQAIQAELKADGNAYAFAIRHKGEIDALGIKEENGRVFLCTEGGKISVSGKIGARNENQIGGTIFASGNHVELTTSAHLDVSGNRGGGIVDIGKNSELCFIDEQVLISARAIENGNGGQIFCLSEGTTYFYGQGDVRGGENSGNGGYIEVSGKQGYFFEGKTNRGATMGLPGELYLDPEANITVSLMPSYNHLFEDKVFKPTTDLVNISITTLIEELQQGPICLTTHFEGEGINPGSIRFTSDINHTYDSPYKLSLHSYGTEGVKIEGSLTNLGTGIIEILAPNGGVKVGSSKQNQVAHLETKGILFVGTPKSPIKGEVSIIGANHARAALRTTGDGNLYVYANGGVSIISDTGAPAFMHTENGSLVINTSGPVLVKGQNQALAEICTMGIGSLTLNGLNRNKIEKLEIIGASGPASITTSNRASLMTIQNVLGNVTLLAEKSNAYIQGGMNRIYINHVGGDLSLQANEASATICSHGYLDLNVHGDVQLDGGIKKGADASIYSTLAMQLDIGRDLHMNAHEGHAYFNSTQGMNIYTNGHMIFAGTPSASSYIEGSNSALFAGGTILLDSSSYISGNKGSLVISASKDITLCNSNNNSHPFISAGTLSLSAGKDLVLSHDAQINTVNGVAILVAGSNIHLNQTSKITTQGGDLHMTATQENIHLDGRSQVLAPSDGIILTAGNCIIVDGFSKVISKGNKGATIVVDHLNATSDFGKIGGFILNRYASVETGEAPLLIYSSNRHANTIEGTLNGFHLAKTPEYLNSHEEKWGVHFPVISSFPTKNSGQQPLISFRQPSLDAPPFVIFYKDSGLICCSKCKISSHDLHGLLVNKTTPFTSEMFRDLHPYNEYVDKTIHFAEYFMIQDEDLCDKETFSIKKRTFKYIDPPSQTPVYEIEHDW